MTIGDDKDEGERKRESGTRHLPLPRGNLTFRLGLREPTDPEERVEGRRVLCRVVVHHVGVRVPWRRGMCDVCRGKGGARVIQCDRDGSTAPGSLELLMRSPPPLVFLGSSLFLSFSPFKPLHSLLSAWVPHPSPFILPFRASYLVTPSTSEPLPPPCSSSSFSAF